MLSKADQLNDKGEVIGNYYGLPKRCFQCEHCGSIETKSINNDPSQNDCELHKRECLNCGHIGSSDEHLESLDFIEITDGTRWFIQDKESSQNCNEIDPSTLKHSFDNGTTWYTEDEIKEALEGKSKSCGNCDRWTPYLTNGNFGECFINKETWAIDEYCSKHEPK